MQIHLFTHGCHSQQSLGHFSVAETEMLRDPESGQQVRVGRVLGWVPPVVGFGLWGNAWAAVRLWQSLLLAIVWVISVCLRIPFVPLIAHFSRKVDVVCV